MKLNIRDLVSGRNAATGPPKGKDEKQEKVIAAEEVTPVTLLTNGRVAYRLERRPPEALVIHCADARFQPAFRQFVAEELGINSYFPIIIGGGIHAFGVQNLLPKNFKILWQQIKFVIEVAKPKQVIIINHEDCLWYNRLQGYHPTIPAKHKGILDLRTAAERILLDFSGVKVRTFWAAIEDDSVVFSEK